MRISDWSSDVCSSDLFSLILALSITTTMAQKKHKDDRFKQEWQLIDSLTNKGLPQSAAKIAQQVLADAQQQDNRPNAIKAQDRKSVVEGKSVSVRVDLGGRRIIKKKKKRINKDTNREDNKYK